MYVCSVSKHIHVCVCVCSSFSWPVLLMTSPPAGQITYTLQNAFKVFPA